MQGHNGNPAWQHRSDVDMRSVDDPSEGSLALSGDVGGLPGMDGAIFPAQPGTLLLAIMDPILQRPFLTVVPFNIGRDMLSQLNTM
ncbi:hypothetical protein N7510_004528 [Penicillium lagena]|uniref:uncharacterized protein n=1 Tax=Penicillium lagena TaxID=94218 RepID=UPI002540055E|nr:uncharacterized protein N7510_004528 [Penicillium lagena]KAJ5620544.1 hypothetical protein N7510_004528 [Penicillium lagena]